MDIFQQWQVLQSDNFSSFLLPPSGTLGDSCFLYSCGKSPSSGFLDLYCNGATTGLTAQINLMVWSEKVRTSGYLDLFTFSMPSGGSVEIIEGSGYFITYPEGSGHLNLFVGAPQSAEATGSMPLYIGVDPVAFKNNTLDLFLCNVDVERSINLFTIGSGVNPGFYPTASNPLNLFINRPNDGAVMLFIGANGPVSSGVDLYSIGSTEGTGLLNLCIPNTKDNSSGILNLYVRGF